MAAWYTRRQWESAVDNGHRQLRAYVFPEQANLVWQGTANPTAAEIPGDAGQPHRHTTRRQHCAFCRGRTAFLNDVECVHCSLADPSNGLIPPR